MNASAGTLSDRVNAFCAGIGRDPLLVQGAGGNVSWKDAGALWVKASGTWLAEAAHKNIFVPVDLPHLQAAMAAEDFAITPRVLQGSSLRPSIETLLHALMPHEVVAHLHAIEILAHLVRDNPEQRIRAALDDTVRWTCVEYFKPGAELAKGVADKIASAPQANVVFLRSHGVVIGGEDVADVESTLSRLVAVLRNEVLALPSTAASMAGYEDLQAQGYAPCSDPAIHQLAIHPELCRRLASEWALYPDHVVFLGPEAVILRDRDSIARLAEHERKPPYVFVPGQGVFEIKNSTPSQRAQLRCYFDVLVRQPATERLASLSDSEVAELLNWEAEKYRQRLPSQPRSTG
jgi:rhamnose utilization protein RhaD (predicted bifunctional aldolase and dehydrogenase)